MLTLDEGRMAVSLARGALTTYIDRHKRIASVDLPGVFQERRGVFVTLHEYGELRGCIGYPQPVMPLGKAIIDSAIQAGTGDPRFPKVVADEFDRLIVEVTILTEPQPFLVEKRRLPDEVRIGKHGLIVSRGIFSGLLLPQVATEWGFDSMDFLAQTCLKAGLPPDAWLDKETDVMFFEAQIFSEDGPRGVVNEKLLSECKD
ncbi:MAG: TIGR00296 family protein [Methanotrichaceae archaeon]|nr:TIGR00296 family protein [Methanotrichaceae archaeon]